MKKETVLLGVIAGLVVIAAIIGASYYRSATAPEPVPDTGTNYLIRPDSPVLGPEDAPVTIVEFYDPECESCAAFHDSLKRVLDENKGKTRLVARLMPLHPNSALAATFIELAGEQGKYWEAQEFVFKKQPEWGTIHGAPATEQPDASAMFDKYAVDFGLDPEKFRAAVNDRRYMDKFQRDLEDGRRLGVSKTPTIFVNGKVLMRLSESDLRYLVERELKN
ncbi:MAG: disulfide bond formation protein DsbA [Acidobacteria bacterium]|nr:MAG: disulfide bond formation protein DsbA [Acidobacteriota bacterium]REK02350.1 MAG: disulfide bond formation protein DsbA [Acidobacteriota bacterium]REK13848.1 MAG: disulfide bond formation protein DsbA [Acidobacteriota bacterium]REK41843.1 MAG: disulfide bond formation protein DsbA [Acidobacteriota bacterium]